MKRDFYKPVNATNADANLVVELSATQCSFLALDVDTNNILGYSFYSTSFKLSEEDYFLVVKQGLQAMKSEIAAVGKVNLFLDNSKVSFIPSVFFNANDAVKQFSLQHGNLADSFLLKETSAINNVVAVFEYNQKLQELIKNEIGNSNLYHSYISQSNACFSELPVTIVFHKFYFNICVKKEGRLQVMRRCSFETEADVVYQILNIFRLLDIPVESCVIGVCGAIDESSALYKTLNEFLFDIQLLQSEINLVEEAPAHYFYHLLQFNKCV